MQLIKTFSALTGLRDSLPCSCKCQESHFKDCVRYVLHLSVCVSSLPRHEDAYVVEVTLNVLLSWHKMQKTYQLHTPAALPTRYEVRLGPRTSLVSVTKDKIN
jgi:hypothetical protein